MPTQPGSLASAIDDFRVARNRAALQEILARLTGQPNRLLSFDEVRQKLKAQEHIERGLQDIPLDAIVGSVGRYSDFTRDFLPLSGVSPERWARVKVATTDLVGLPPIEVYKLGDVYFVKDGNHRVSVARQLGATHIQAYVTEIRTPVPLTPDLQPDDLIIKAEYAGFLEQTHLDQLRPEADLSVTVPGQYEVLSEHIAVHRYFMGLEQQRYIPYQEAAAHWYDTVYLPIIQVIRERGILRSFPGRTETDLYLWIADHRAELQQELGWEIDYESAATDLANQFGSQPRQVVSRLSEKFLGAISLDVLQPGPPAGHWRSERPDFSREDRLFADLLVPLSGEPDSWSALDQALLIALREGARLHGLHVVASLPERESDFSQEIQEQFNRRCSEAGLSGELNFAVGEISQQICSRARWVDLIVTHLAHPPAPQPIARLSSGFRDLIQRCPRPVMAVPRLATGLDKPLLAYDGSPKSDEALYVATYLAAHWQIPLVVISVINNGNVTLQTQTRAREYLEAHGVNATYIQRGGPAAETILEVGQENQCNFTIMGGYGFKPLLEVVLGSVVDQVMRECNQPILVCR